ncbi:MAG: hypothetical protein RR681_03760 [Lachnospiraceae bacterium]
MRYKKRNLWLLVLLLFCGTTTMVHAQDTTVVYQGDAKKFVAPKGEWTDFTMLEPGTSRTQRIILNNRSQSPRIFILKVDILDNMLKNISADDAHYTITVMHDKEILLKEKINTKGTTSHTNIGEELKLATLEKNQQQAIDITVSLDGASVGNEHQGATGNLQLTFATEDDTSIMGMKPTKTGDERSVIQVFLLAGGCILSAMVIGRLVYERHQKQFAKTDNNV